MHVLAEKYTNKKCHAHSNMHSIPWRRTLFNSHPFISSSNFSANCMVCHCYLCRDGCWIMYINCLGMECISLCAWHFLFVYFVSQCIAMIPTWARFLFRNLFNNGDLFLFFLKNTVKSNIVLPFYVVVIMRCCPCTCSWCIILTHVHRQIASNSQYTLPPQSSLQKSAGAW